jgi:hypothetical protein
MILACTQEILLLSSANLQLPCGGKLSFCFNLSGYKQESKPKAKSGPHRG